MGQRQSGGSGSGGNDKSDDKEKKRKYEPPVPTRVGKRKKKSRGPDAATKLPQVTPYTRCRLKMLKLERIKDFLLMEEEFIKNQERLKPQEEKHEAFKTIKGFLSKLERVSENPEFEEEYEKEVTSGSVSAASASGWTGWAVTGMSSLTSKIYNKATTKTAGKPQVPVQQSSEDKQVPKQTPGVAGQSPASSAGSRFSLPAEEVEHHKDEDEEVEETGDGWEEDNWGDLDDSSTITISGKVDDNVKNNSGWDDDDDDWGSLEDTGQTKMSSKSSEPDDHRTRLNPKPDEFVSTKSTGLRTTDFYDWGMGGRDDFFSSVGSSNNNRKSSTPVRQTPPRESAAKPGPVRQTELPASTKSISKKSTDGWSEGGSGWDDGGGWGGDNWDDADEFGRAESQADKMKKEREEKKKQRQKEMQEKREAKKTSGAMKLGVKKVTDLPDLT